MKVEIPVFAQVAGYNELDPHDRFLVQDKLWN